MQPNQIAEESRVAYVSMFLHRCKLYDGETSARWDGDIAARKCKGLSVFIAAASLSHAGSNANL